MPLTQEENDLLTRVDNGAPMGEMIRQYYWLPAVPSIKLIADGAPVLVRLLGVNYVAFRTTDGRAGVIDELCPHRKTSLMTARNEDNGLRCIYHGWKMDVDGKVVEAPNQTGDQAQFCQRVKTSQYHVQERGGIVWVWLGKGDKPPRFPDLPFTNLPAEQRSVTSVEIPTNWVQGVEASMDSSHVGSLHETTTVLFSGGNERIHMTEVHAPRLEFEDRNYGFRYAAMRDLPDSTFYARVNNFVLPWYAIICPPTPNGPSTVFFSVPADDVTHRAWFVHFNTKFPLGMTNMSATPDVWNFPPLPPGTRAESYGQNRDLMKRGHASGFYQHLGTEDFAMFLGQGPIVDRVTEQLCSADGAVVRLRSQLLKSVREFMEGKVPTLAANPVYPEAISAGGVVPTGTDWRTVVKA
jgi:phenylpropionate dioxygenase-like ring-hydroxylating dioxygenase large terminal subunit